ncbi:serine/threonine protein kinase, partial [Verrucomicrobia bacterium]|nr:serine/threonine protein kinase [Verrucomicrobiota bacterium]
TDELNSILQKLLQRNITKRYVSAESLLHDLEYHIYRHGYGPTNETLGKFVRSLKGNIDPSPSYESL